MHSPSLSGKNLMCGSKPLQTFKFPALSSLIGLFEQKHSTIGLFKKFTGNLAGSEECIHLISRDLLAAAFFLVRRFGWLDCLTMDLY